MASTSAHHTKVCVIPTSLVILASPKNGLNIGTPDKGLCNSYFTGHSRQSKEWPQHRHTRQRFVSFLLHWSFSPVQRMASTSAHHTKVCVIPTSLVILASPKNGLNIGTLDKGLCHSYFTGHSRQSKEWPQHRHTIQRFVSFLLHWSFSRVQRMASTSAHHTKVCVIPTSLVILASPKNGLNIGKPYTGVCHSYFTGHSRQSKEWPLNIGTPDKGLCHSYFTGHSRQSKEWPQHRQTRKRFVSFLLHWSFSPVQRMASTSAHQTKVCVIPTSLVILASPKNGLNIGMPDEGLCHSYFTGHSRQSKEWPQHRHTRQRFVSFRLHWSFSPVQRMASTSAHQTKVCVIHTSLVILASPKNGLNIGTPDKGLCHSYFTGHSRQSKEWPQHRHTRQRFVSFLLHWSFSPVERMASTSAHQTRFVSFLLHWSFSPVQRMASTSAHQTRFVSFLLHWSFSPVQRMASTSAHQTRFVSFLLHWSFSPVQRMASTSAHQTRFVSFLLHWSFSPVQRMASTSAHQTRFVSFILHWSFSPVQRMASTSAYQTRFVSFLLHLSFSPVQRMASTSAHQTRFVSFLLHWSFSPV